MCSLTNNSKKRYELSEEVICRHENISFQQAPGKDDPGTSVAQIVKFPCASPFAARLTDQQQELQVGGMTQRELPCLF